MKHGIIQIMIDSSTQMKNSKINIEFLSLALE
jgi:hypothetical protein